jgi:Domain of unknown function (DUF4755)
MADFLSILMHLIFGNFWLIAIGLFIYYFYKKKNKVNTKSNAFENSAKDFQYMQYFQDTGIAVDPKGEKILLLSNGQQKEYPFSAIRSWSSNVSSGGHFVTGSPLMNIGMAGANIQRDRENKANTGFFIEVKDIDYPVWRISFPSSTMKQDMAKWTEVLRQHVNKDS